MNKANSILFQECNCGIGGKSCIIQTGECICKVGYTGPKCERIKYKLRVMRVKMGSNGMDGGAFGIKGRIMCKCFGSISVLDT